MAGFGCSCAKKFKAAGTFLNLAIMGFRDITMKGYRDGQPSSFSSGLDCHHSGVQMDFERLT